MDKNDSDLLFQLLSKAGPSCGEKEVQAYFGKMLEDLGLKVKRDQLGNVFGTLEGDPDMPRTFICAHADSVGYQVKFVDECGFLYVDCIGGYDTIDYRCMPGTEVEIICRNTGKVIPGHFNVDMPIHAMDSAWDLTESMNRDDLLIDTGLDTEDEIRKLVSLGDYVVIKPNPRFIGKNKLVSANLDDRIGMWAIYTAAREIVGLSKKSKVKHSTFIFASTLGEEIASGLAGTAARQVEPVFAIVVDTTMATDQIRVSEFHTAKKYGVVNLGGGPVLPRGKAVNDDTFITVENMCIANKIKYQVETSKGNADGAFIESAGPGVRTIGAFIPLRNLHTNVEMCNLKDVETTSKLIVRFWEATGKARKI